MPFLQFTQGDSDRPVGDGAVAQVGDEGYHAPHLTRIDTGNQAQGQHGVLHHRCLHGLHRALEVLTDLVSLSDVIGLAAALGPNLQQQILVPICADTQRDDGDVCFRSFVPAAMGSRQACSMLVIVPSTKSSLKRASLHGWGDVAGVNALNSVKTSGRGTNPMEGCVLQRKPKGLAPFLLRTWPSHQPVPKLCHRCGGSSSWVAVAASKPWPGR